MQGRRLLCTIIMGLAGQTGPVQLSRTIRRRLLGTRIGIHSPLRGQRRAKNLIEEVLRVEAFLPFPVPLHVVGEARARQIEETCSFHRAQGIH